MIGCSLVIFNPDVVDLLRKVNLYVCVFAHVAIYDNSPTPIEDLFSQFTNVKILGKKGNCGIASAQNSNFSYLEQCGCDYIVELDQDTEIPVNYLDIMEQEFQAIRNVADRILGICPSVVDASGIEYRNNPAVAERRCVSFALSSGLFLDVKKAKTVGLKNESWFIDLVDWEWCLRAGSADLKIYRTPEVSLQHCLGEARFKFLGQTFGEPKPFRHYYQFRNTLFLIELDYVPLRMKLSLLLKLVIKFVFFPFILSDGRKRLHYMILGIKHAMSKKKGALKCNIQ